jgi:ATP phosphoribosyltransferase regulatory subunit
MSRPKSKPLSRRQSQDRSLVPVGMATILPHTAQRVRYLEGVLLETISRWGYREIIPPTFEYLDVLSEGLEPNLLEQSYKFADRTTGRMLVLRPDVTAQIARMVAMGMLGATVPMRLSYRTTVFRHEPEHAGREREIFQVGAELIGQDDVATDGEIIALLINCLSQIGLKDFKISIGHVGFFTALLARSGMSAEGQKRAEQAAARKDLPYLEQILQDEHVSKAVGRAILEAPELYGRTEVLDRGRILAGRDRAQRAALDRLAQLYRLLTSSGLGDQLVLDLGEFRGFDYYDGVVFDVFAGTLGCELGGGGRYNHLIGRFGRDLPSTGFALDVNRLFRALEPTMAGRARTPLNGAVDLVVCAPPRHIDQLASVAQMLRQAGRRIVQAVLRGAPDRGAIEEARRAGAPAAVIVGLPSLDADEALLLTVRSGVRRKLKIKDLTDLSIVDYRK